MSLRGSLKRSGSVAASRALVSSTTFIASVPGGRRGILRAVDELSRTFVPRVEWLIEGGHPRRRPSGEKLANVLIDSTPGGALSLAEIATKEGSATPKLIERLATRCEESGDLDAAVELRRRAVDLDPGAAHRHSALARTCSSLAKRASADGDSEVAARLLGEAVSSARRALELVPGNSYLQGQLGRLLVKTGQHQEGIELLAISATRKPSGEGLRQLAEAYRIPEVADHSKAFRAFERSLARNPKDRRALLGLIETGPLATADWGRIWRNARRVEQGKKRSPYRNSRLKELLDRLFMGRPGLKTTEAVVRELSNFAVNGRILHPAIQRLVEIRLQSIGGVEQAYRLIAVIAETRGEKMLQSPIQDTRTLRRVVVALATVHNIDQASLITDPQHWRNHEPAVQREVQKLHAEVELLKGHRGPYIKYARQLREETPNVADELMGRLVKGKRVALVGSQETDEQLGSLINEYDVVLRVGAPEEVLSGANTASGNRVDIAYLTSGVEASLNELEQTRAVLGLRVVVDGTGRAGNANGLPEWLRPARPQLSIHPQGRPGGLVAAVYDLLQFKPEEICLFRTDFHLDDFSKGFQEAGKPAAPGTPLNQLVVQADLKFDFTLFKVLQDIGVLTGQGRAEEVLNNSVEEYLRALDQSAQAAIEIKATDGSSAREVEPRQAQEHLDKARALLRVYGDGVVADPVLGLSNGQVRIHEEEALNELHQALEYAPGDPVLLREIGNLLLEKGGTDEGLTYFEAAVAKRPSGPWFRELADAYRRPHVARFEKALVAYERAFQRNAKDNKSLAGIINIGVRGTLDWPRLWRSARLLELRDDQSPYQDEGLQDLLDRVFRPQPDSETIQAALERLDALEVRGQELHPSVQGFLATRLQFMGHLGHGYDLRAKLAERRTATTARDERSLRQLLKALIYLDDYEQAAALSEPRFWPVTDPVNKRKHEKIHAEAHLMLGDAEKYLEYSQNARELTPLPADAKFEELMRGKRVAIVGPVDAGDQMGRIIDGYDVIVRPRFNPEFVAQHPESMGSRTDVAYINGQDIRDDIPLMQEAVDRGELQMAVARPLSYSLHHHQNLPWLRFYRQDFGLHFHGFALGLQRFAYDVLQFAPAEIGIFNTDMYTGNDAFASGYRDDKDIGFQPGSIMNDLIVNHDLKFDFKYMKSLEATSILKTYGKAAEVMALTPEEYVHAMEAGGALK